MKLTLIIVTYFHLYIEIKLKFIVKIFLIASVSLLEYAQGKTAISIQVELQNSYTLELTLYFIIVRNCYEQKLF